MIFLLGGHAALKRKKCGLPHENSPVGIGASNSARGISESARFQHGVFAIRSNTFAALDTLCLAPKARYSPPSLGQRPRIMGMQTPALKARFTLAELSHVFSPESFRGCLRLKLT
jgi:hypothetical protein